MTQFVSKLAGRLQLPEGKALPNYSPHALGMSFQKTSKSKDAQGTTAYMVALESGAPCA